MAISPRKLAANQENARRSTGPRTPEGKANVRFNAVKHGLLAQEVIVPVGDEQEKRGEFESRLEELWQHYAPVGPVEEMLVEKIAVAYWRLRRATRAEVGELMLESDREIESKHVVRLSEFAAQLHKQVQKFAPNNDFGPWLEEDGRARKLGWDDEAVEAIDQLGLAERKPALLQKLEDTRQRFLKREAQKDARNARLREAAMVQRSIPLFVDKILRYETTIERQLYRAIAELEKLQAARRPKSSPASGPTRAAYGRQRRLIRSATDTTFLPNKATGTAASTTVNGQSDAP
jgi:hypothetical protein